MLSEEWLLLAKGMDSETTFKELVLIVDEHVGRHQEQQPTLDQWENLADVAFLAQFHGKPKSFERAVKLIARIFALYWVNYREAGEHCLRATILICSDAPTDRAIIFYMLGNLKAALRDCRLQYAHLSTKIEEVKTLLSWELMQ